MATVVVNGKEVDIGSERLNLIQAAQKAGVFVPHYCWHPTLTVVASCRMCLVEVGEKKPDGSVVMQPKVVPGCQTPAKDGTVVVTNSDKARAAQAGTLEDILLNHPLDCSVCDKAGECMLQDFSFRYGRATSRMIDTKNTPPNKPQLSSKITLFTDRCILCSRCVRFTREVSGTAELQFIDRGHHLEVDVFPGQPLENKLSLNVVDLCPVGALCGKDFLYKQRVWMLESRASVCADCSTGCSVHVDANKDIVYRLRPRVNPESQGHFMCDEGRLGYRYANSAERLRRPLVRKDGVQVAASYTDVLSVLRRELTEAVRKDAAGVVGVLSPFLTCEEAYLLARYLKGLSGQVRLALGPVPVVGENDTYPKNWKGEPVQPVKFTIRAEKCPNRRGVEEVLRHFQGDVIGFDDVLRNAGEGRISALYLAAGYPPRPWMPLGPGPAVALSKVPLLIVHDLFATPVSAAAKYVIPASTFAEKHGTFVNHAGLAQTLHWVAQPPGEVRTDGQVFLDLLDRRGLLNADKVRAEMAAEVPSLAPLARADLGEYGIRLESRA